MPYVHGKSVDISFMSFQPSYTWNGVSQHLQIHQTSPYFFWCCLKCIRSLDIHMKCDMETRLRSRDGRKCHRPAGRPPFRCTPLAWESQKRGLAFVPSQER